MKKVVLSKGVLLLFLMMILTSCSSDPGELTLVEDDSIKNELIAYTTSYKNEMIEAVNEGSIDALEKYLIPNSTFYHLLRSYINDKQQGKAELTLVEHSFGELYINEYDEYYLDAFEKTEILNSTGTIEIEENEITYAILDTGETYKIIAIHKR